MAKIYKGYRYRSGICGQFVTAAHFKRSPSTTVREKVQGAHGRRCRRRRRRFRFGPRFIGGEVQT